VMSRGDRREPIFKDDADRKRFLETLTEGSVLTIDTQRVFWEYSARCHANFDWNMRGRSIM
jgi:hypothetical protein